MRITAGGERGRRLLAPPRRGLRPTSERVREALFSILQGRIEGARLLDLYAGTGAVGLEALSRGAAHVDFVEVNRQALRVLRGNLARCGVTDGASVHPVRVETLCRSWTSAMSPVDVVFADPPYGDSSWREVLAAFAPRAPLGSGGVVVLEHATREPVPKQVGRLGQLRQYRYGDTMLTLFGLTAEGTAPQ